MAPASDARFCPGCGHADWPQNCPTACPVGARFRELEELIGETCSCGQSLDASGEHPGGYGAFCG